MYIYLVVKLKVKDWPAWRGLKMVEKKRKDEEGNADKLFMHFHLFDTLVERQSFKSSSIMLFFPSKIYLVLFFLCIFSEYIIIKPLCAYNLVCNNSQPLKLLKSCYSIYLKCCFFKLYGSELLPNL